MTETQTDVKPSVSCERWAAACRVSAAHKRSKSIAEKLHQKREEVATENNTANLLIFGAHLIHSNFQPTQVFSSLLPK